MSVSSKKNNNKKDALMTALMRACEADDSVEVGKLIKSGANVNELDSNKRNALFYCIEHRTFECFDLLVQAKADINLQDKDGYTLLHLAVINGNQMIVELLHKSNANLNVYDSEMHGLVHWCVVCGHVGILDYLLKNKCNTETADIHGAYPLHYAAQMCGQIDVWDENIVRNPEKSLAILKQLIEHKVKIEVEDYDRRNPMIWASSSGSADAIIELFNAGGNPIKHEKDGLTPLHCAASRGHCDCVEVLLERCRVPIDIMDNNDCTPLFYSVTLGQAEVTEFLIRKGANLSAQDCKGRTVYHCAAAKGQFECLEVLLKHDSSIWLPNRRGDFPVHEAYYNRSMECVYHLLNELKHLNALQSANTRDGRTLLHLSAAENDDEFCEKLLNSGAYVNSVMSTSAGTYLTPYDVAKLRESKECMELIQLHGGTTGVRVATIAAFKIQRNLKKYFDRKIVKLSKVSKIAENTKVGGLENVKNDKASTTAIGKPRVSNSVSGKVLHDKCVQTTIRSTTQKLIVLTSLSPSDDQNSNKDDLQIAADQNSHTALSLTSGEDDVDEISDDASSSDIYRRHSRHSQNRHRDVVVISDQKKKKKPPQAPVQDQNKVDKLKPIKNTPPLPPATTTKKSETIAREKSPKKFKRYFSERHATDTKLLLNKNNKNEITRFNSKPRSVNDNALAGNHKAAFFSSNTPLSYSSTTSSSESSLLDRNLLNYDDYEPHSNKRHQHYHCHHHHCHHNDCINNRRAKTYRTSESDNEGYIKINGKIKNFETDVEINKNSNKKLKLRTTAKNNGKTMPLAVAKTPQAKSSSNKKLNDEVFDDQNQQSDFHVVKLIIKADTAAEQQQTGAAVNNYQSLFERQRLLLKSLYEIRRSRLNNRNIVINADLNNLLIKNYSFDIQKNCKSLKELERLLEILAMEISDDFKKFNKKSKTLKINKSNTISNSTTTNTNTNTSSLMALSNGALNSNRTSDYHHHHSSSKQIVKTKSVQSTKPNNDELTEYLKQKRQQQNTQLKTAYKPLLPDDIYKQYYDSSNKNEGTKVVMSNPKASPRDKTIFLPVLRQKQNVLHTMSGRFF